MLCLPVNGLPIKSAAASALSLAIGCSSTYAADDARYVYEACASRVYGLSIGECKKITVSNDLTDVRVGHTFDLEITRKKSTVLSIDSKILPISIPSKDYSKSESWENGDFEYVKVAKNVRDFPFAEMVDVIAVVPKNIGVNVRDLANKDHEVDVMENALYAFSYSSTKGVTSVSVIAPKLSSEVYHCISDTCLFGK